LWSSLPKMRWKTKSVLGSPKTGVRRMAGIYTARQRWGERQSARLVPARREEGARAELARKAHGGSCGGDAGRYDSMVTAMEQANQRRRGVAVAFSLPLSSRCAERALGDSSRAPILILTLASLRALQARLLYPRHPPSPPSDAIQPSGRALVKRPARLGNQEGNPFLAQRRLMGGDSSQRKGRRPSTVAASDKRRFSRRCPRRVGRRSVIVPACPSQIEPSALLRAPNRT
jgi:hypothetical protein